MNANSTQKMIMTRVAIVVILMAAAGGVLYAKHVRGMDGGGEAVAPPCPCSSHNPVTPGQ